MALATLQELDSHMCLVVTVLDRTDMGHFNHESTFYWTELILDPFSGKKKETSRANPHAIDYSYCCPTVLKNY